MIIFALHSENSEFQQVLTQLNEFATVETFEEMDFLLETIEEEECHGIILEYDDDRKKSDKEIKKIKKLKNEIPLFLFSNTLDSKKLIKHQKSKLGAALYLQTPIDQEMLTMLIEPFWQGDEMPSLGESKVATLGAVDQKIVDSHVSNKTEELSGDTLAASEKIDGAFSAVFPEEYTESSSILNESSNFTASEISEVEEFEAPSEIEISMNDEQEDDLEGEDLSPNFPTEDDLTFPELDLTAMGLEQEEDIVVTEEDNISNELDLGGDELEEFELSEDKPEGNLSVGQDESFELDLSEEIAEREEVSEEVSNNDVSDDSDLSLEVDSFDEEASLDLSLSSDNNEEESQEESQEIEELSLSFGSESDEASELSSEDLPDDLSIDLAQDDDLDSLALSDESIEDINSDVSLSSENDDLIESLDDIDDELTRPAFDAELLGISEDEEESDQSLTQTSIDQSESLNELNLETSNLELGDENTIMGLNIDESLLSEEEEVEADDSINEDLVAIDEDKTDIYDAQDIEGSKEETRTATRVNHVGAETKTSIETRNNIVEDHSSYVQTHEDELVRLGETINTLRSDRELLLDKVTSLEEREVQEKRDFIGLKAQLDEKQIELVVVKKRLEKQIEELKVQIDLSMDKRAFLEKKNQNFSLEIERLNKEHRLDYNRVHQKERELEERLEMLRKDSEIQLRNRDQKILELKRRIDSLEFDIESSQSSELNSKNQQVDLEDKMDSVIKTLRNAIGQLEDDNHQVHEKRLELKKNLKR